MAGKKSKNFRIPYDFLNKHEEADLNKRWVEYNRPNRGMEFECFKCGCTELVELRPEYGECANCKQPYLIEDDRRNVTPIIKEEVDGF